MVIDQTGTLANIKRHDYLPFGEELFAEVGGRAPQHGYTGGDGVRQQFTLKERDNETGLDYFGARYFASTQGRFTSSDPLMASGRPSKPQSWNRYSYVLNNPLRMVDPDGLKDLEVSGCTDFKDDENNEPQDVTLVKSATIKVGSETIQGEVGTFGVVFNLTQAQTETLFQAESFSVNLNLVLPETVETMTPTVSPRDLDKVDPKTAEPPKSSGSKVLIGENSNFSTVPAEPKLVSRGQTHRASAETGITFSELKTLPGGLKNTTASTTLSVRSQLESRSNSLTMRLEGRSERDQTLRFTIQVSIRPSKQ